MLRHIDLGRALLALGGLAVLVALFLDWFELGGTGWEVFESLDLIVVGLVAAAVVPILRPDLLGADSPVRFAPFVLLLVVVVQLIEPPPAAVETDARAGMWVALVGSLLMVGGAVLGLAQISVSIDVADRQRRRDATSDDRAAPDPTPDRGRTGGLFSGADAPAPAPQETAAAVAGPGAAPDVVAPADPRVAPPADERRPAEELRPSPDREAATTVREVPAVDRRRERPSEADITQTQPLTPPPDAR